METDFQMSSPAAQLCQKSLQESDD